MRRSKVLPIGATVTSTPLPFLPSGSGKIFYKMGHAFGKDMVKRIEGGKKQRQRIRR